MDHVNNAAYVDYIEEVLLAIPRADRIPRAVPRRYLLDYALPASLGDRLELVAWPGGEGWNVHLATHDGRQVARARAAG
jgi:acyl-ACP thioesterase